LLDLADFPRPTVMLVHQLHNDDDVVGRMEAADLLSARTGEQKAVTALVNAMGDTAWAVRLRVAAALGSFIADSQATRALLRGTADHDPRVRVQAATSLSTLATLGRADLAGSTPFLRSDSAASWQTEILKTSGARLRAMVNEDSSRYVRAAALMAFTKLVPGDAQAVIDQVLQRNSWLDMERTAAVHALTLLDTPQAWSTTLGFIAPSVSRATRLAAISALVTGVRGRRAELVPALVPLLGDDDLFIRIAAAHALGSLGERSVSSALEARLSVEAESRVITAILGALASLQPKE
jgi:HEAT repeat protein